MIVCSKSCEVVAKALPKLKEGMDCAEKRRGYIHTNNRVDEPFRTKLRQRFMHRIDIKVPLVFLLLGTLWIVGSDWALSVFVENAGRMARLQTIKGWTFVAFIAVVLYLLLRREISKQAGLETRYKNIFDSAVEGIITFTSRGEVEDLNPAAQKILGWSRKEMEGRSIGHFIPSLAPLDQFKMGKSVETTGLRKDGKAVELECSVSKVSIGWEHPDLYTLFFKDLTDKKNLENQLLRTQRLENIGAIASGVAHDLNNIFAPIMMAAELFKQQAEEEEKSLLETIEQSAQRGAYIVRQLLTFGRGVAGKKEIIQVEAVTDEILNLVRRTFPKSIQIRSRMDNGLWPVVADSNQLHQVFMNLCVNARDAMPDGGRLSITAANTYVRKEEVQSYPEATNGHYVYITVEDTGGGILKEHLERIFDPYFTTKAPDKGTGLGLSTVLGIVKSFEGFITVESQEQRGTKFGVYLPAVREQGKTEHTVSSQAAPKGQGELILVVDDEENVRLMTKRILEQNGYRAITASHGAEAIAIHALQPNPVHLAVIGSSMPIMDGPKTGEILLNQCPAIKVLLMSGMEGNKFQTNGDIPVIAKPFSSDLLLRSIHRQLMEA